MAQRRTITAAMAESLAPGQTVWDGEIRRVRRASPATQFILHRQIPRPRRTAAVRDDWSARSG